jgi:aspartyl-tRNA(Asn)/glutamyl-tRNA(Gln) amidotransferase subunit C
MTSLRQADGSTNGAPAAVEVRDSIGAMSGTLSRAEVDRLAALAHLELDEREADALTRQLAEFLEYARQVQDVPTAGVPPTTHVLTPRAPFRDDQPAPSLDRNLALANAPEADRLAGLFKVPRVIGE